MFMNYSLLHTRKLILPFLNPVKFTIIKFFALQRLIIQNFSSCPSFSNKKDNKINKMTILYHLLRMNFYLFKVRESSYFNVFQYWPMPWMTKKIVFYDSSRNWHNWIFLETNLGAMTWKFLTIESHCCSLMYLR